jgi:hypothetical protein
VKEAISLQHQGEGQAVGDVGEGNLRAIWRSLMRIRSAVGDDDDRVTTTFAQRERALSTAGTAQQRPPANYWTSCAVYPFAFTPMPVWTRSTRPLCRYRQM